jgi:tRNA-binding EMAP/Myf-like protein
MRKQVYLPQLLIALVGCHLLLAVAGFALPYSSVRARQPWRTTVGFSRRLLKSTCLSCSSDPVVAKPEKLTELSELEIRVGKIVQIDKHPEASLYVEQIDIGNCKFH